MTTDPPTVTTCFDVVSVSVVSRSGVWIDTVTAAGELLRMPSEARYVNVSLALHTPRSGVYVKDPSGARVTVPLEGSLAPPEVRGSWSGSVSLLRTPAAL